MLIAGRSVVGLARPPGWSRSSSAGSARGRSNWCRSILLGLLVVEGTIYADPNMIPAGLFHPGSGSTQLRLPEIYITLALIARLIARGRPKRIGLPAGLWLAFAAGCSSG